MKNKQIKLHLGCGTIYFKNWINVDLDSKIADVHQDLTKPLTLPDNMVDYIYSEHFIEHIKVQDALFLFEECLRVLKPNGVLRIATPDLDHLIYKYLFRWKKQTWIKEHKYEWLGSNAEMLNTMFHEWGHQYLYNGKEMKLRLKEAGFKKIKRCRLKQSKHKVLCNLETRDDSKLIIEATK